MLKPFLHGFLLAFGLILPLGVQNVFVFTQGATQTRLKQVLPVVVVAGLCDMLLILLAVAGVSVAVLTLKWLKTLLVVCGVVFLIYFGWLTWKNEPKTDDLQDFSEWTLKKQILFTLSVSLLNPHAILDTIGVIGTTALTYTGYFRALFTLACIMVSWLWFFTLALSGRILGKLDSSGLLRQILNRVSAVIMWFSAIYLAYNIL